MATVRPEIWSAGILLAIVSAVCFTILCKRHFIGFTGDTVGDSDIITHCLFLFGAAVTF
jgi:cobalamin synthase